MEASEIKTKILLLSLATVACIEVGRVVMSNDRYDPMVALGASRLLETGVIILIVITLGKGISSIGLTPSTMLYGLKKGFMWSAGFALVTLIAYLVLSIFEINPVARIHTQMPKDIHKIVLYYFFVGGLIGPIAEEVIFRGILYGFFRRWGILVAVILTTLLFVLAHILPYVLAHPVFPNIPITQVVGGVVFALAYEIEKNLMVPVTIHVLGNMAIFSLSLIR
jgi:membrane protease YdiL (CAAX protease family)